MLEVHVTFPNAAEAESVSRAAVEKHLAACANLQAPIHSFYWWGGKLQSEDEVAVIFKTKDAAVEALMAFVSANHSYDVPAIIVHRPLRVAASYEQWVQQETVA
jgi:periplasmic divalent cation tolerance protein